MKRNNKIEKVEREVLEEIKKYVRPGEVVQTCCMDNPQMAQIIDWGEKLRGIKSIQDVKNFK